MCRRVYLNLERWKQGLDRSVRGEKEEIGLCTYVIGLLLSQTFATRSTHLIGQGQVWQQNGGNKVSTPLWSHPNVEEGATPKPFLHVVVLIDHHRRRHQSKRRYAHFQNCSAVSSLEYFHILGESITHILKFFSKKSYSVGYFTSFSSKTSTLNISQWIYVYVGLT